MCNQLLLQFSLLIVFRGVHCLVTGGYTGASFVSYRHNFLFFFSYLSFKHVSLEASQILCGAHSGQGNESWNNCYQDIRHVDISSFPEANG